MRRGLQYNLGAARVDAKGTAWDYLAHPRAIPVQIMASHGRSFEVVKAPPADQADVVGNSGAGSARASASWRGFDANPAADQADQCTGKRLLELSLSFRPTPCGVCSRGPVQRRQQGLDLAKFRRPLMTETVDRTQQEPQPDFLRHCS